MSKYKSQAAPCGTLFTRPASQNSGSLLQSCKSDIGDGIPGSTVSTIGFGVVALAFLTGAAAGPVFIMVDQMQYMSVIGRIGGGTSAANSALSETMGLFNFEFIPNIFEQKSFKNPLWRRRDPQKFLGGHQDTSYLDMFLTGNITGISLGFRFGHVEDENRTMWSRGWLSTRGQRRQVSAFSKLVLALWMGRTRGDECVGSWQDGDGEELGMNLEEQTEAEMADPGE